MEELEEVYFVPSNLDVEDENVESENDRCEEDDSMENENLSTNNDTCVFQSPREPIKFIVVKEDGRVEILDKRENETDMIVEGYIDDSHFQSEITNNKNMASISKSQISGDQSTDTGESEEEGNADDPQYKTQENVTIVRLKNAKQHVTAKIIKAIPGHGVPAKKRKQESAEDRLRCKHCNKTFTKLSNKSRHMRVIHKEKKNVGSDIRCMECNLTFKRVKQLRDHLQNQHNLSMAEEELHFPNLNAFKKWKCEIERKTLCSYTLRHGSQKTPLGPKYFYVCHRSGRYHPKVIENRQRMLRVGGSCKLGIVCTAAMYCQVCPNEVIVNYFPHHYGHGKETAFVQLSPEEQTAIQESVSNGVSFESLLDDIRDSQSKDTFQLFLLKKRDFRWINSAFQAEEYNPGISDAESVENWVRNCCQMEDSPVLFYQQHNIGSDQEEFMLVIMTEFQKHILYSAKKDVVCVDSLYQRKGGRFYLTLLFVMDEFDNAFPVALCISNKVDKNVIGQFYSSVKESAGALSFKYFMSDSESYFYELWVTVMNDEPRWLWSIWYIDHKIRTQLKVFKGNVDKRAEVYKTMRMLLECQNESVFQCMFKNFIDNLHGNPITKNLGNFIISKYGSNSEMWASCYRQEVDLSTNIHLEVMHRTFRYCCREGRKKRLDKFLFVVMKLVKCKMLDRISNLLDDEKLKLAIEAINMCHSAGLEIPAENMSALSENIWLIQTADEERPVYVTKEMDKCPEHCSLRCDDCDICVHQYSCSCVHSMINANLCMHIHAVVWKFLTPHFSPPPSPVLRQEEENELDSKEGIRNDASKSTDVFDKVLKRTHDIYRKVKVNRCNLNKYALDSILKRLNECVDICMGKEVKEPVKESPAVVASTPTYVLNPYIKGPNQPFILPNPQQTGLPNNNGVSPQYVLLVPGSAQVPQK